MSQIKGEIFIMFSGATVCCIHYREEPAFFQCLHRVSEFDDNVGIGNQLASLGFGHEGQVSDEDSATLNFW